MTSSDADDASPSPDYSGDLDDTDMAAEQRLEHSSGGASPAPKTTNGAKPASNAKDPLRPRRKKARRACFACQRAHLTCGDERPCNRCIKRGLQDHCMDGVRKKAKYLHDAPDGALMPGVGGHYPYMNGNRPTPIPNQDTQPVALAQQSNHYVQPPPTTFYSPSSIPASMPATQDVQMYNSQQSPISPPFTQSHQVSVSNVPSTMAQGQPGAMQQFGGALFDPSDPALFNFDISNLNFGNHYGALEFGMLNHMSSGAAETPPHENGMLNPMNQAANMYNPPVSASYGDHQTDMSYANGLPTSEWQDTQSRHGSMHVQTPNNTPATATIDHFGHHRDSIHGPHAFAIGQGPASHSTASPASTDANSGLENDNPMASARFFAHPTQPHAQRSPTVSRQQQENRRSNVALQPLHSNGMRKRQRDTKAIYQGITKPYDYVKGWHNIFHVISKRYSKAWVAKAQVYFQSFRPVLLNVREELDRDDLIHQEKSLQRNLLTLQEHFAEVGTPFLICRRSGEVVGMNKELQILTGWKREVLIGQEPNMNINLGSNSTNRDADDSEMSTQTNTTPTMAPQDTDSGLQPVNILELMDGKSALEYLEHFSELCYQDSRGFAQQRVNMLRYQTKGDVERSAELRSVALAEPIVKVEGGATVHQGESAMQRLGGRSGLVDCMIWWHIKRDTFDIPMLVCMSVMPVLDKGLQ
ncbi:hypothetical protein P153DRAFT_303180 [Dothidotthia symphoricarpi CBS 119687]|uniref:Zn(2)-C6 fungal-type domain-containing protein n=1 Tax=Dothidotthia symphoricarpi CBS 119687 TaxID=1392245 RepID=A0A6A5ZYU8_9PLEO|nr:uncharacterized protein P153DRAFT_303180 [Dothidotthia symphoricarpi CBS 119687]KAF2124053.1 hypothetical protein P153DRAFT_303180 [Dothidotthia symphoricarpi CBS 119687]